MQKQKYTVFVDEIFEDFMNFPDLDGYFCYVGLMLPDRCGEDLERFWKSLNARLVEAYRRATGFQIEGEFKSKYLGKLSSETRRDACRRIFKFLRSNGGYVSSFYTTVHALLCWEIRTSASSKEFAPITYSLAELQVRKVSLIEEKKKTVGESNVLNGLFNTISGIAQSWLSHLGARYSICYDKRDKNEDRVLLNYIADFFEKMPRIDERFEGVYVGGESKESHRHPGLMLVDLLCREARDFMQAHPSLIHELSKFELITPTSKEGYIIPHEIGGRVFKWGSAKMMNLESRRLLASKKSPFSELIPCLADGKLSLYAHYGESRVADLANGCYNDMVD